MRIKRAIDMTVRQRNLELRGTTSWLAHDLLAFNLRGKTLNRGQAELRLDLYGTGDVVEASVRIMTIELGGMSRRNNYTARIVSISENDRARLDAWFEDRSRSVTHSTSRSATRKGGRQGIRDALRSGLDKSRVDSPDELPPQEPPATTPDPTGDLVLAPTVKLAGDGSSMSVTWSNAKSVTASWEESLCHGKLRVYLEGRHPPRGYTLIVQLCLPDGSVHAAMGRVDHSDGPTLYLNMTLKTSVEQALSTR